MKGNDRITDRNIFRFEKTLLVIKSSHKHNTAKSFTKPCPWLKKEHRWNVKISPPKSAKGKLYPMPNFDSCSLGRKAFLFRMTVILLSKEAEELN